MAPNIETENAAVVRRFLAAWSRLDPAEISGFFAQDAVYHNIPALPVRGKKAIERFISDFIRPWTSTEWDVLNVVAAGDIVMAERIDRTRIGGKQVDLPCCGVFEMEAGKIKAWRDYFDLQTYIRASAAE